MTIDAFHRCLKVLREKMAILHRQLEGSVWDLHRADLCKASNTWNKTLLTLYEVFCTRNVAKLAPGGGKEESIYIWKEAGIEKRTYKGGIVKGRIRKCKK